MAGAIGLQNKMWNFIDLFYINQKDEQTDYATDAYLKSLASQIPGVNVNQAMGARNSFPVTTQLKLAETLAAKNGVTGTPTFFVGPTKTGALTEVTMNNDLGDISPITSAVDAISP
jgi:protein-disulfide isomerase